MIKNILLVLDAAAAAASTSDVRIVYFSFRIESNRIAELLFEISNRIK